MSVKVASNRFIVSPYSVGFYQQLSGKVTSSRALAARLIRHGEYAKTFRKLEAVREVGQILSNFPLTDFHIIGQYYLGWCETLEGGTSSEILERVAEHAPITYRSRAIHSLAAIAARKQDYSSELDWLIESLKLSPSVEALRGIAVVKAKEGYHRAAVKDLEQLLPLARLTEPLVLYDCLNSLAVELGEVGHKYEARNIIRHVLASPFAKAYPEWLQTAEDLKPANRSFAVLRPTRIRKGKLLTMPIPEHGEVEELDRPARVINLQQWKVKMGKDDTPNDRTPNEKLDDRELTLRIFQLVATRERTQAELYDILVSVEQILEKHKNKNKDEDED